MKAVILAAGQGTRLRPLTNNCPKCLIRLNGNPILKYQLEALHNVGIQHCIIVVGFKGDHIQQVFGSQFADIDLQYIWNTEYESTNNIYSLWLAKDHLSDDMLLIEGDVLFEHGLLADIGANHNRNIVVVDKFRAPMNGTIVLPNGNVVASMVLGSKQSTNFDYSHALKTVNIYVVSQSSLQDSLIPTLNNWIGNGFTDQFYEAAIAELISTGDIVFALHRTGNRGWVEIDTLEDIHKAEELIALW